MNARHHLFRFPLPRTGLPAALPLALMIALVTVALIGCDSSGTTPPENTPPVADAGPDMTTKVGNAVTFDGSASHDPDGDPLTYTWQKVSGPSDYHFSDFNGPTPTFIPARHAGIYEFQLTVSDGTDFDSDVVAITVEDLQAIEIEGTISSDSTLADVFINAPFKVDYIVVGPIHVVDRATLTIESGVKMAFAPDTYIEVGRDGTPALQALGTENRPVVMTADTDFPAPGHWAGLTFWGGTHPDTYLVHTHMEYCGQGQDGCLWTFNGTVGVRDVTIEHSGSYGVNLAPPGATGSFGPGSVRLSVENSALNPIRIRPNQAGTLPEGGIFEENAQNTILVTEGAVTRTQTWPNLGIPYEISDRVRVMGENNPILTLVPGTEVRFGDGAYLEIGRGDGGVLQAVGTADEPIVFTSASPDPQPGDWGSRNEGGINFWSETANGNQISHAVIEYANNLVWFFHDIGVIVTNSTLRNASDCAFRWYVSAEHTTNQSDSNTFSNNAGGKQCEE